MAKKHIIVLALILLFSVGLLGCRSNESSVPPHEQSVEITLTPEEEKLVPKDSTVLAKTENSLSLTIPDTLENTIQFYQTVIESLGVEGAETTPEIKGDAQSLEIWNYDGTYDEGKPFSIKLISSGEQVNAVIVHSV